jgi:glycosyltransferase involved in cell wall biosynthesis
MPRVSVVMSVYNGAKHLAPTIDSILAQTERDLELVVVDDGSTDATPEILRDAAARDSRVRVIEQANTGLTRALIAGCAAARAPYIARQDAGDLSHPRRLAAQCRLLDDPDVTFVSCATQYVGPEDEPLWVVRPAGAALEAANIIDLDRAPGLTDGPTHHGSVLFRRDAYERAGGYRPQFYYGQDFDLWYRLAALGRFRTTDEVLYTARVTPDSISGAARGAQQRLAKLSRAALDARMRGETEEAILAEAASIGRVQGKTSAGPGLYLIGEALRRNGDPRARPYLRRAIAAQPFSLRAWIRWVQSLR